MGTINTGNIRSLTIEVTKYIDGKVASGYPKQYDGKSGFTWNYTEYQQITEYDLQRLDMSIFNLRLEAWKSYVESIESGLNMATDLDVGFPAYKEDSYLCPIDYPLEITADLDCSGNTLTITVTGGTAPYQYSIDNGENYTTPTSATTYTFTDLTGTTFQPMVIDYIGNYYRWEELSCEQITVTFVPIYLTSYSTGYIEDELGTGHTSGFTITQDAGTYYEAEGFPTSGTTFAGWSFSYPRTRGGIARLHFTETNPAYNHLFKTNITVYGVFIKDGPITGTYCYYPTTSGYTANDSDRAYYCSSCENEVTVYFNKAEYLANGAEGSTWYSDEALTTVVPNGYYKIYSTDIIGLTLYQLVEGVATPDGICDGTLITCV